MTSSSLYLRAGPPVFQTRWPIVLPALAAGLMVGLALAVRPEFGIGALLGVLYLPVLLLNLPLGIAVWVAFVFVEVLTAAPTLLLIMIAIAWVGALRSQGPLIRAVFARHRALFFGLFALVLWVCASLAWARETEPVTGVIAFWFMVSAGFTLIATTISQRRHLVMICAAFILGAVISVIGGAFVEPSGASAGFAPDDPGRFGGTLGDANYLAAGLVAAMAISVGLIAVTKPASGYRWVLGIALVVLATGLGATGSRGGLIASLVAVLGAFALTRTSRVKLGAIIAVSLTLASIWVATTSPATWDRVRDFGGGGTGRVDLWTVATRISEDNPVLGVGANNFQNVSPEYVTRPGLSEARFVLDSPHVAHNLYLQQLAETGVVGLALLLVVIGGSLAATWSGAQLLDRRGDTAYSALARAILVAQLSALTASLFISNVLDKRMWILLALGPVILTIARLTPEPKDA